MATSIFEAGKNELLSLTPFQRSMHTIDNNGEIASNFYRPYIKSTWHSNILTKLKSMRDGEETVYTVNKSFHFLNYTYIRFVTGPQKVKDIYKKRVIISVTM